jgi:tRNA threonylcarbamoyladenosine biosynthesis protein TsaE
VKKKKIVTKNFEETQEFSKNFAKKFKGGEAIALYGDLGAGKTTFTQGLARGLGIKSRTISPTFVILRSYRGKSFNLHHLDLYRLISEKDVIEQGIFDLFNDPKNIVVIEWAEKMENFLPKNTIRIHLKYLNENTREIEIK